MSDPDLARLLERLRAIEALYARAGTDGEQVAASKARERILERLGEAAEADPPVEYRFTMADMWSRRVFVALLRRYGLKPYRYKGQRHTTVMVRVSRRFVDETLWPQYTAFDDTLRAYLGEVTDRVVGEVLHADLSEAAVVDKQLSLPAASPSVADPVPPPQVEKESASSEKADSSSSSGASSRRKKKNKRKKKKRR